MCRNEVAQKCPAYFISDLFVDQLFCTVKKPTTSSLPPANEVWGKVMFLHLSVILFTGGGSRWVYLGGGEGGLCPGGSLSGEGLCQEDPPYGKERAVRILLECILVILMFTSSFECLPHKQELSFLFCCCLDSKL